MPYSRWNSGVFGNMLAHHTAVVRSYKALAHAERAFRSLKTVDLKSD
jgi:hypothetical protein